MAIVAVSLLPVGAGSSIGEYVAETVQVAMRWDDLRCELGPIFTTLEGTLPKIFETVIAIQEAIFEKGTDRVSAVTKVDERRGRNVQMDDKVASVGRILS